MYYRSKRNASDGGSLLIFRDRRREASFAFWNAVKGGSLLIFQDAVNYVDRICFSGVDRYLFSRTPWNPSVEASGELPCFARLVNK